MQNRVQRSWLIAPANDDARLAAAASSGADVVVLDLQDTVHDTKKHDARARVKAAISEMRARGSEVYVRCDPELLYADFAASVWRGLHGVVLPGLTTADEVREADRLLGEFEAARGVVRPPPMDDILEADDPRGPRAGAGDSPVPGHRSRQLGRRGSDNRQRQGAVGEPGAR